MVFHIIFNKNKKVEKIKFNNLLLRTPLNSNMFSLSFHYKEHKDLDGIQNCTKDAHRFHFFSFYKFYHKNEEF